MRRILCLVIPALLATGCVKHSTKKFAVFTPGDAPRYEAVKHSGEYHIRCQPVDEKKPRRLTDEPIVLIKGDVVGFETTPDGATLAHLPYGKTLTLDEVDEPVKYLAFTTRVKQPTQFGREMRKAGDAALTTGVVVGMAVTYVAVEAAIQSMEDDSATCHKRH